MSKRNLLHVIQTPLGRIVTGLIGLGLVVMLLVHSGLDLVASALSRAAPFIPLVFFLELCVLTCTMLALRLLYGQDRHKIPTRALARAGLVGYAVMGLVPAGRTFAETTRAAMLAKYSTGARAAVAATQLQGIALLANGMISIPALFAMYSVLGSSGQTGMVGLNLVLTITIGFGILFAGRMSFLGKWIGKKLPQVQKFGSDFDQSFSEKKVLPVGPLLWECLGRVVQVLQNAVLVLAVGGQPGVVSALCSEALHLVGAMAGDLIPAQLGATELNYKLSAGALGISPADALSIALLAHLAQLFWVMIGVLLPMLRPASPELKST